MSLLVDELKKAEQARRKHPMPGSVARHATVQKLFAAKQPEPGPSKRILAIGASLILLLVAVGSGIYFWLSVKDVPVTPTPARAAPSPPAPLPATTPASAEASSVAEQPAIAEPPRVAEQPAPVDHATAAAPAPAATIPGVAVVESGQAGAAGQILISPARSGLNPALKRAYDAYMAGQLTIARSEYQQVLNGEPKSADALHGLAAISLRQGEADAAEEYYLRAIEVNPKDALAQAGLIGLRGQRDPQMAESRLKTLLAAQPELSFLHIALGNLYAAQNRWSEAQQSFFKAYITEPENPDTLFNLAVSLDHLRQAKQAQQYYKQALVAAEKRPASFDRQLVSARLREIQH